MAETLDIGHVEAMAARLADPSAPPSVAGTAESILNEAIESCARKMGAGSSAAVVGLLLQNDRTACEYYRYGVAKLVAVCLGSVDANVQEVYVFDYGATAEDVCFGQGAHSTQLIHLLVRTQHRTAALDALVAALDRALVQAYADAIGSCRLKSLLDVQIVDDTDVQQRHGYGGFWAWVHQRPIQIWKR